MHQRFGPRASIILISLVLASVAFCFSGAIREPAGDLSGVATRSRDPFALVLPDDCEDIFAICLEVRYGYRLARSSGKPDIPSAEFVLTRTDQHGVDGGGPIGRG